MRVCDVEGCGYGHYARGLCNMHWQRWRKYGDAQFVPIRVRPMCSVDDCKRPHVGRGYCMMHWMRWRTHGDPHIDKRAEFRTDNPTYRTMHDRLRKLKRGQCSTQMCEETQTEMALIHGRGTLTDEYCGLSYSIDPGDYTELCVSCHRTYDTNITNII